MSRQLAMGVLWFAAAVCGGPAASRLDTTGQAELVRAHNAWRERVGAPPLRWSTELATLAHAWAETLAARGCRLQTSARNDLGENLLVASPLISGGRRQMQSITPTFVVDTWGAEARNYSSPANRCAPGKTCGHYTQMVWRTTQAVGCGMALCPDLGQIWVCNYRPAGNIEGQRPF